MSVMPDVAPAVCRALAAEMREMAGLVEALAAVLAIDHEVVARHLSQLQQFDLLAQHMGESARLLDTLAGGDCLTRAIDMIRLEQMQDRFMSVLRTAV